MTPFEQIEKLLNSNLDIDDEYGYRDLGSFINDYNETINALIKDRYSSRVNKSLEDYNLALYKIVEPHFDIDRYELLKLEIKSFCNKRDHNIEYFFNDNTMPLTIDTKSDFHRDLNITIRHEHLEKEEGIILYEFQESFFEFTKLRFIYNLYKKDKKKLIIDGLTINSENKSEKNQIKDYFDESIESDNIGKLISLLNKNKSGKYFAMTTCILTQKGLIKIPKLGRKKFFRIIYKTLNIKHKKNFSFKGIYDFIIEQSDTKFFCTEDYEFLSLQEKINLIFDQD